MSRVQEWRQIRRDRPAAELGGADRLIDPAALGADIEFQTFILDGRQVDANLTNIITGGTVRTTIEAASTLELDFRDTERWLLRSRLLTAPVDMFALGLDWAFAGISYSTRANTGTLRFEDARVAEMRRHKKARKVARSVATRAQFIKMLVDELPVELRPIFVCPELKKKQPIGRSEDRSSRSSRDDDRDRGIASGAKLKIRGDDASRAQLDVVEFHFDIVESFEEANETIMLATAMILINETGAKNLPGSSDGLSRGAMQLRTDYAEANGINNMNMAAVCRYWLTHGAAITQGAIEYAAENPNAKPAEIARAVWGGTGFALSTWTRWADEARALVDAYGGHSSDRSRAGGETKRYEFSRGRPDGPKGEDTWACSLRLAEEVGWRRFMVRERFYYMAEEDLIRSRPRATIKADTAGIDDLNFDIDARQKVNELTIDCRAKIWKAPPGSVIALSDDFGLAEGRWLVSEIERPVFGLDSEISLRRGAALLKEKPEPAPETVSSSISVGDITRGSGRQAKGQAVYEAAKKISDQKRSYEYGGGHKALSAISATEPLDCSSSTSLALWMADVMEGDVAWTSGTFATDYGEPGPGEFVTIWAKPGGITGHVYIEGRLPDVGYWRFDTSQNGSNGPRLVTSERSNVGFTARHPS